VPGPCLLFRGIRRIIRTAIHLSLKPVTSELGCTGSKKEEADKKQVQEIIETNNGSLSRLLSIDGRLVDTKQEQKEDQRIQRLVDHPDEQRTLQQERLTITSRTTG
jgi:hypothetical protein